MINKTIETALLNLQQALLEQGCHLEFIKLDKPICIEGLSIASLHGIGIKNVIHENDAEVWG